MNLELSLFLTVSRAFGKMQAHSGLNKITKQLVPIAEL